MASRGQQAPWQGHVSVACRRSQHGIAEDGDGVDDGTADGYRAAARMDGLQEASALRAMRLAGFALAA